jgi:hypothetical protein
MTFYEYILNLIVLHFHGSKPNHTRTQKKKKIDEQRNDFNSQVKLDVITLYIFLII